MRRRAAPQRRGSSLILVLGILVVFGLVLGVLATVLLADLRASRRRGNDQYAAELARSGTDWARAALLARGGLPSATLRLDGGEITVETGELPDGRIRVLSTGRVRSAGTDVAARREVSILSAAARRR